MDAEEEDLNEDTTQDIKPRHHKAKTHDVEHVENTEEKAQHQYNSDDEDDYEEDDDDEDDVYAEWNLRKCAASTLDRISTVYGNEILGIVLPHIKQELFHTAWEHRECGILVLGAIAEGCMEGMIPHLPVILPMLYKCLSDSKALVRSITCWTIGRYIDWIVFSPSDVDPKHHIAVYMYPLVEQVS